MEGQQRLKFGRKHRRGRRREVRLSPHEAPNELKDPWSAAAEGVIDMRGNDTCRSVLRSMDEI